MQENCNYLSCSLWALMLSEVFLTKKNMNSKSYLLANYWRRRPCNTGSLSKGIVSLMVIHISAHTEKWANLLPIIIVRFSLTKKVMRLCLFVEIFISRCMTNVLVVNLVESTDPRCTLYISFISCTCRMVSEIDSWLLKKKRYNWTIYIDHQLGLHTTD